MPKDLAELGVIYCASYEENICVSVFWLTYEGAKLLISNDDHFNCFKEDNEIITLPHI